MVARITSRWSCGKHGLEHAVAWEEEYGGSPNRRRAEAGDIKLDEIITKTYTLDQVNEGYEDLLAGKNVRGVVVHEH
jgi:threonine dehydrogenase-like Zn-dependent dehydrogenase